mmetsp:Transcript_7907/g.29629  ORF Transcript_7907/g.29629 Transcript_7907/m.29629 type:complete len:213 (-) Transcript_7907:2865-3503(-)
MSSYEELVHEPMSAEEISTGHPSSAARCANLSTRVHKSGVYGPLMCGARVSRSMSNTRSYTHPSSGTRFARFISASLATEDLPVSLRYSSMRSESTNTDVVAPISAPMLQIVAIPVALIVSTPSPKYSIMAPVPPDTVRMSATFRMMSLGDVQFDSVPVRFTPITFGAFSSQGSDAMTSTASAPPTPMAHIPNPPAFGVCESVPIINPPGKA